MNHSSYCKFSSRHGCFIITLVVLLVLPATIWATEEGERLNQIYEKEWAFRIKEFPTMASQAGIDEYAGQLQLSAHCREK